MISQWPSTVASLNDSLAVVYGSLGKLQAAKPVDVAEVVEQLKTAAESSRVLRTLVLAEMPGASWQSREELDAVLIEISKRIEAREIEQRRSRLLALATELEHGNIVHRRAVRVNQLSQLRDQAVKELQSQAGSKGMPEEVPGPEAGQWIAWACALQEPEDAEALQALRGKFAHLDEFVANLEPEMWVVEKETHR